MRIKDMITLDESKWYFNMNSPHYFYWKRIAITNENLNFDIRGKGLVSFLLPYQQQG